MLSGGELPALVVVDAVARLVPGVVGDEQSVAEDSFSRGLLDFPHYTRPAEIARADDARTVPDVLLSGQPRGDSALAEARGAAAGRWTRRPDLLDGATLDDEERADSARADRENETKEEQHERD